MSQTDESQTFFLIAETALRAQLLDIIMDDVCPYVMTQIGLPPLIQGPGKGQYQGKTCIGVHIDYPWREPGTPAGMIPQTNVGREHQMLEAAAQLLREVLHSRLVTKTQAKGIKHYMEQQVSLNGS